MSLCAPNKCPVTIQLLKEHHATAGDTSPVNLSTLDNTAFKSLPDKLKAKAIQQCIAKPMAHGIPS